MKRKQKAKNSTLKKLGIAVILAATIFYGLQSASIIQTFSVWPGDGGGSVGSVLSSVKISTWIIIALILVGVLLVWFG